MTMDEAEKDTKELLIYHFKSNGGKDYYFKSSQLKKDLPKHDTRVIGRTLTQRIAPTGMIELWSTGRTNRTTVWKTCFNGEKLE